MLVVVAIIALLISILLPSLAKAGQQAIRAVCAGNFKNVGNAYYMYAQEHRDVLPPSWSGGFFSTVFVDDDPDAERISVGRDWDNWAKPGLIDNIAQMLYTDDYQALYDGVGVGRQHAGSRLRVTSCIDCYCGFLHTPEKLRRGTWVSLLAGADEVMIVRDGAIERLGLLGGMKQIRENFERESRGALVELTESKGG